MGTFQRAGTAAVMLAMAGGVLAAGVALARPQTPSSPGAPEPAPSASTAKPPKAKKARSHKVNGVIEAYDSLAQTLTLKTSKGSMVFSTAGVKVWANSKSVAVDRLGGSVGARATVAYVETESEKHATSVRYKPSTSKPPTEVSLR